jgi:hypothetical protein
MCSTGVCVDRARRGDAGTLRPCTAAAIPLVEEPAFGSGTSSRICGRTAWSLPADGATDPKTPNGRCGPTGRRETEVRSMGVDGPWLVMLARDALVLAVLAGMTMVVAEGVVLWWRAVLRVPLDLGRDLARALARPMDRGWRRGHRSGSSSTSSPPSGPAPARSPGRRPSRRTARAERRGPRPPCRAAEGARFRGRPARRPASRRRAR